MRIEIKKTVENSNKLNKAENISNEWSLDFKTSNCHWFSSSIKNLAQSAFNSH